jgi:hypothetical protein
MLITYTLDKVPNTDGYELYFIRTKDKSTVGSIAGIDGKYQVVFDTYSSQPPYTSDVLLLSLEEAKKHFIEKRIEHTQDSQYRMHLMFHGVKIDPDVKIELL